MPVGRSATGVPINDIEFEGQSFNQITPKSGGSYGLTFGVFVTENVEIEFALDQQKSALEASGRGGKREFADVGTGDDEQKKRRAEQDV